MRMLKRWPVRTICAVLMVISLFNAAATGFNIVYSSYRERWVNHSLRAIIRLNEFDATLTEAETAIRGYMISSDESYLKPFNTTRQRLDEQFRHLKELLSDNPSQLEALQQVNLDANSKLDNLEKLIANTRQNGRVTAEEVARLLRGKSIMDGFRSRVADMEDVERQLLAERRAEANISLWISATTAIIFNLAMIAMLGLIVHMLRRETDIEKRGVQTVLAAREETATAQRQSADTLALLDTFLMNAPLGLAFLDRDLRFIRINRYLAEMSPLSVGECVGKPVSLVLPHLASEISADLSKVVENGAAVIDRIVSIPPQSDVSEEVVWQSSYYPVRDTSGSLVGVGYLTRDITQRLRDEQRLKQSEERFRVIAETLPQIVWVAQPDGTIEFFNQRWFGYTGLTMMEEPGAGWTKPMHPDERDAVEAKWRQSINSGAPFEIEYRLRKANGSYRWFLGRAIPILDENNLPSRWFGTATDIHDQKQAKDALEQLVHERTGELRQVVSTLLDEAEQRERVTTELRQTAEELRRKSDELGASTEALKQSSAELTRSNQELEQFAFVASHDLQEPLRKIQAFGDRMKTRYEERLDDQGKEYLSRMLNSAFRMRRLIDDLLSYSRVATKTHSFETVNLNETVLDVLTDLEERVESTGAMVEVAPLPTISADRVQMRQLFQNLIANALKFRKPGIPPQVAVRCQRLDHDPAVEANGAKSPVFRIEVADQGIGFDTAYLGRLFQVFQRLHGKSEYEGTGIGLAVCRKIVERHGGTITARSQVGAGATFIITLPDHADNSGSEA